MSQEMLLDRRHAHRASRNLRGKPFGLATKRCWVQARVAIKPEEKPPRLVGRRWPQLDLPVNPARTDQSRIQPFRMVGREEKDPSFARAYAIERFKSPLRVTPVSAPVVRHSLNTQSTSSIKSNVAIGKSSTSARAGPRRS